MSWCTIESDPGVFSELVSTLGVKDVAVEEIYSLGEEEQQQKEQHSYGLVFLFKWREEVEAREILDPFVIPELFFAKQVVQNACATQAILSVLLNSEELDLGPELTEMKSFGAMLDPETRGMVIGQSDTIRVAHNSFARPEPFVSEESKALQGEKEDAYHFIAYVPFRGSVYEIDGLKSGPVFLGEYDNDWLAIARPAIEARMQRYSSTETHFALLSIKQKRSTVLEQEIHNLEAQLESITLHESSAAVTAESGTNLRIQLEDQLYNLRNQLEDDRVNQERQKQENIRRRHNYIPFIMVLLKALSKKGALKPMIDRAVTRQGMQNANKKVKV